MFLRDKPPYYLLILLLGLVPPALAQPVLTYQLGTPVSPSVRDQLPTMISGDQITGRPDVDIVIKGHAEIRKNDTVVRADQIEYNQVTDEAKLSGNVVVNQAGNRFWGPALELNLTDFTGHFRKPSYRFYKTEGEGSAESVEFVSPRSMIAELASYSTCKRPESEDGKPWKPDWIIDAKRIEFDLEEDVATASGVTLRFMDVPILAAPSFTFPISDARRSGLLTPTFASDSQSGFVVKQPIYWNIAPQRDATLYPTLITRRGMNYGSEFRYLEPNSTGTLRTDYLPNDQLFKDSRWAYSLEQRNLFASPGDSFSDITTNLKLNRVSDNQYWRDMPNSTTLLTQRVLNNELSTTGSIAGWATQLRFQRWQTLQDITNQIVPPFDRSQLLMQRNFQLPSSLQLHLEGDVTQFQSNNPTLIQQPNGTRAYTVGQLSKTWTLPWGYIKPKLQLHASRYRTQSLTSGETNLYQRTIPTLSLDSGLTFEREASLFGGNFLQTLEPRAFYVRTPYRDQSMLPNYDSGVKDFSLSTIYSENSFIGNDRVSDMNMLTLGLTSRLFKPASGEQVLSAGFAQRFSFIDQKVTLPNTPPPSNARLSDYLISSSAQLTPALALDGAVQVGANSGISQRSTISTRYTPSNYRSFYAAYRMQQSLSEQFDIGWQWPLGDILKRPDEYTGSSSAGHGLGPNRWYSVARMNYSAFDKRMVGAIVGLEYDADCWIGRIALEKTQLDSVTTNQRIMFQLEFVGFSRLGISPLASLRTNIQRYQNLREQISPPSRYSQYD